MDISFDYGINNAVHENIKGAHNDSFCIEDEILNEHDPINNFLVLNNKGSNHNAFLTKDNANLFFCDQKIESDLFIEDIPNQEKIYFLSFSNNNNKLITNINKETNLTQLH